MRFKNKNIGNLPKEMLSGKVTIVNLRTICKLLNEIYANVFCINFGLRVEHEVGCGYRIEADTPQRWMGGYPGCASDSKTGIYHYIKRCMNECHCDLTDFIMKEEVHSDVSKLVIYKNQLEFIEFWLDRPENDYSELAKHVEL